MKKLRRKLAENLRHPKGGFGILVGWLMNFFNKGIIQTTLENIPLVDKQCIVEVGIGNGKTLNSVIQRFPDATFYGIDLSKTMLESAKRKNKKSVKSGKLKLMEASIQQIDLADNSVDTLYTVNTLYFWKDPDSVCEEIFRLLKPNGYFILSFNPLEEVNLEAYPKDLFTFYSVAEVESIVKRKQFKIVSRNDVHDSLEKYVCLVLQK